MAEDETRPRGPENLRHQFVYSGFGRLSAGHWGFDFFYWLDCLDTWLFEQAHQRLASAEIEGGGAARSIADLRQDPAAGLQNIAFYESAIISESDALRSMPGALLRLALKGLKRTSALGGHRGLMRYLLEILKGAGTGLKRRKGTWSN